MFIRFVQFRIRPEAALAFQRFYEFRVASTLLGLDGCMFARLIQSDTSPSEFISFTLWKMAADAEAYESSGLYDELLSENEPFTEDSAEWKIQLSADMTLDYSPVVEKPTVQAMPVVAGTTADESMGSIGSHMYVRILSTKVKSDHFPDLRKVYDEHITPELLSQDGCRAAWLVGAEDTSEAVSVTIWDERKKAEAYENGGKYEELLSLASPYLSSLNQWKMSLDPDKQSQTQTSEDVSVRGYHVVTREKP